MNTVIFFILPLSSIQKRALTWIFLNKNSTLSVIELPLTEIFVKSANLSNIELIILYFLYNIYSNLYYNYIITYSTYNIHSKVQN